MVLPTRLIMSKNKKNKTNEKPLNEPQNASTQEQKRENPKTGEQQPAAEPDPTAKELEELKEKYAQLNDSYLRSRAEFENFRKRSLSEKAELIKNGGEKVLVDLLPVIDDFERGLAAMDKAEDVAALKEGMNIIYSKIQSFLKRNGVEPIETKDQPFNTDLHEAIAMIPAPQEDMKGKVIDCTQKGYKLGEKVIRFAKVVVGE